MGGASTEERTTKQLFGSVGAERRSTRTMWAPAAAAGGGVRVARPPTCGVLHVALRVGASPRGARLPPAAYLLRRFDLSAACNYACTALYSGLCRALPSVQHVMPEQLMHSALHSETHRRCQRDQTVVRMEWALACMEHARRTCEAQHSDRSSNRTRRPITCLQHALICRSALYCTVWRCYAMAK